MSHTAQFSIELKKNKIILAICGECGRRTEHKILTAVTSVDGTPDDSIQFRDEYLTIQCRGCKTVSFCRESINSDDTDDEGQPITTMKLFPGRIAGRPPLEDLYHLPGGLRMIYEETRSTLMDSLPILSGIGIRAIVETVCNDQKATGRNLVAKIEDLVKLNLISKQEAGILHSLRFMGNEAAHKVKIHSGKDLNLAFDIVEHLLKTVYLLPEQAKELPSQTRNAK
jgi:hypothetical protein